MKIIREGNESFMFVISKKRILVISMGIFISIFSILFMQDISYDTVETVSLPISGKVVVVDAGHGVPDEGDSLLKLNSTS